MSNGNQKLPKEQPVISTEQVETVQPTASTSNPSKKEGWLTDTRKTFISLLATPLTVAVTIYFTNWIRAPKPEIENIEWTKYTNSFPPSDGLKNEVISNNLLVAVLREGLERVNSSSSLDWLNGVGNWNKQCQDDFYKVSFEVEGILQDMLNEKSTRQSGKLGDFMPVSPNQVTENTHALAIIKKLQKELQLNSQKPTSYTGEVDFTVGVLNKGDADGVVYDEATLKFKGKEITLFAEDFTPVKAHSFEKITFPAPAYIVDDFAGRFFEKDSAAIKEWTQLMKNKEIVPYEIEITFNNKSLSDKGTIDH
jgi:hypothetical protein